MKLNNEKPYKFGSDYFSVNNLSPKKRNQLLRPLETKNVSQISNNLPYLIRNLKKEAEYIDSLKNDIQFSSDVAAERCSHLLPYNDQYYDSLYDIQKQSRERVQSRVARMRYSVPQRHRCANTDRNVQIYALPQVRHTRISRGGFGSSTSTTEENICESETTAGPQKEKRYWDEYMLSLMSRGTAQYLAFDACHDDTQAKRLQELVQSWYGATPPYRELVPDDTIDTSDQSQKQDLRSTFPYKYYMDLIQDQRSSKVTDQAEVFNMDATPKQRIADLLSREISFYDEEEQTDPYGDNTKASFYRLPALVRRQKKNTEILDKDSGNKTAENIREYCLPVTPPRHLNTILNSKIGDKVLMTDNQFQQDLLISTEMSQKKLLKEADDVIMIENKIYRKSLQPVWPIVVTSKMPSDDNLDSFKPIQGHLIKGHNRWTSLPEKEESDLQPIREGTDIEEQTRLESRKRLRDHSSVNLIVDQWRKKWQLTQKYNDSTVDALLKDMADAHPTIRMQAIVTIAKSGTRAVSLSDDVTKGTMRETILPDTIPQVLLQSIEILLDDTHQQVRKAAAVALHSLEKRTEKSLKILREMLGSGSSVDRWTAAQCLALSDVHDSHVIYELVDQLMNSEDFLIHEKSAILLAKISSYTKLVHGMLGEKLNTVSWRQRIIICKTLPLLHGSLNKDILRKLIYLMWNDEHREVRIASSHVIGKTGNGKAVHDELIKKLQDQSEIVRTDALEKIGILKVMTTRMMPAFLKSFMDDFVIVRKEVCRTCYRLAIQDELCVRSMLNIARYDPSFKVKTYAIRALSKIKVKNSEIRKCFIWALLYESEVRVRYEAIHSLLLSDDIDKEIVDILKSRFLVEDDTNIVRLLRKSLSRVGINTDEDIDTVAEVKSEVRRFLSDKNHITDVILGNEAEEDYHLQRELMIAASPETVPYRMDREMSAKEIKVCFADFDDDQLSEIGEYDTRERILENINEKDNEDVGGRIKEEEIIQEEEEEEKDTELHEINNKEEEMNVKEENIDDKNCENMYEEINNEEKEFVDKSIHGIYNKEEMEEEINVNETSPEEMNNREVIKEVEVVDTNIHDVTRNEDTVKDSHINTIMVDEQNENNNKDFKEESKDKYVIEEKGLVDEILLNTNKKEEIYEALHGNEILMEELNNNKVLQSMDNGNTRNDNEEFEPLNDVLLETDKNKTQLYQIEDSTILESVQYSEEADSIVCTYRLPSDTSYLKVFSSERSLTWMKLETPVIFADLSQLNMLESTISSSIMDQVNSAIEFEGIDCGPSELI